MARRMKIDKEWKNISEQSVEDDHGNVWKVSDISVAAKDLDVMDIPLDHLCIDRKIAETSLRQFVAHMKMVLDADLSYPIILDENGNIFDGRHRAALALLNGDETIKAVRFDKDPAPTFVRDTGE